MKPCPHNDGQLLVLDRATCLMTGRPIFRIRFHFLSCSEVAWSCIWLAFDMTCILQPFFLKKHICGHKKRPKGSFRCTTLSTRKRNTAYMSVTACTKSLATQYHSHFLFCSSVCECGHPKQLLQGAFCRQSCQAPSFVLECSILLRVYLKAWNPKPIPKP